MSPLHDNDLDRLSREAAEHFEVEPGASGWEHLEMRLDQELPQKKKRRRFLFWLFLITATTGGAITGIIKYKPASPLGKNIPAVVSPAEQQAPLQSNNPVNSNPVGTATSDQTTSSYTSTGTSSKTSKTSQSTTNQQLVAGSDEPLVSAVDPKEGNQQPTSATTLTTTADKNITKQKVNTTNKKSKPVLHKPGNDKTPLSLNYATITPNNAGKDPWHSSKLSKRKPGQQQNTAGKNNQSRKPVQDNTIVPDTRVTANDQPNGAPDENTDLSTVQAVAGAQPDSLKNNNTAAPLVADSVKTVAAETVKKEEPRKKDKTKQPLELGLMAGPDMSTVAFGPLYKTGYNFGVQIGYRFSDRWSVNTGIIYTKKFYQADSQHYKIPTAWDLDEVKGHCSMWEIPVNLRYDVSYNEKRRWFVSTGLSTYLMDKEFYTLYYNSNGTPYSYPWESDTNSSYFFSIWNISGGMERSLGKHFSIQAEPYLKIPLQGLGHGKMRMDSYGILFTLKYKPTFKAKKTK